jgi:hypothetical protein
MPDLDFGVGQPGGKEADLHADIRGVQLIYT